MTTTVAVVGGGPAGLMVAEVVASHAPSAEVTIYDRMPSVGRKFQLAGRGGLNLTHTEPLDALLARYGPARPALTPAIEDFPPSELRAWSTGLGQRAVVGTSGRVFPEAFRATPLLRAWLARLRDDLGVEVRTRMRWTGWDGEGRLCFRAEPGDRAAVVTADATVLALGGASWPRTGSDGSWVASLEAAAVRVAPLRPANVGFVVDWSEHVRQRFGGTPLKNVGLRAAGREVRGEAMVTASGIEGGAVYAMARELREAIATHGSVQVRLDLRPDVPGGELAARLARRRPKDSLANVLRRAGGLPPVAIALLREAGAVPTASGPLAARIKDVPLTLTASQPLDRAISTAGGVALDEVDDRFMLRARPGTFVAGEMLDWEAPTGGYLLQATFSTAVAAAHGVLDWLDERDG